MDDVGVSVDGLDYGEAFVEGTGGGVAEGIEVGSLGVCVCMTMSLYVCACVCVCVCVCVCRTR